MIGPHRLNRVVLVLIGLVLLAIGGYGLLRGFGGLGDEEAEQPVLLESVRDFVGRHDAWFWPAAAAASLLLAWLGYRWLRAQVPPRQPVGALELSDGDESGRIVLEPAGLAHAVEADLAQERGVTAAAVQILSHGDEPEVRVHVEVSDRLDVATLRQRLEARILPRLCQALEREQVHAIVRVDLDGEESRTVE